jgi:hypothetical protein
MTMPRLALGRVLTALVIATAVVLIVQRAGLWGPQPGDGVPSTATVDAPTTAQPPAQPAATNVQTPPDAIPRPPTDPAFSGRPAGQAGGSGASVPAPDQATAVPPRPDGSPVRAPASPGGVAATPDPNRPRTSTSSIPAPGAERGDLLEGVAGGESSRDMPARPAESQGGGAPGGEPR